MIESDIVESELLEVIALAMFLYNNSTKWFIWLIEVG